MQRACTSQAEILFSRTLADNNSCLLYPDTHPSFPPSRSAQPAAPVALGLTAAVVPAGLQRAAVEPRLLCPLAKVWMQPGRQPDQRLADWLHQQRHGMHYRNLLGEGERERAGGGALEHCFIACMRVGVP